MKTQLLTALAVAAALGVAGCSTADEPADGQPTPGVDKDAPLYDDLPQSIKDAGEIVFGGDSHPPYRTVGDDGKTITGIDPEIQDALAEVLGVPARTEIADGLPQILAGMQSGRYDAFNGPVKATAERLRDFDGVTWLTSRTSYLVPTDGIDATSTADLCGTTTTGVKGSITEEQTAKLSDWCEDEGEKSVSFLGLADTNATILAVKSGRADSAATTQTGALDIIAQQEGEWGYVTQTDEQGAGVDQLVLLTPKSEEMGEVVLKAFEEIFDSGRYDEIVEKWGLDDVAVQAPTLNPNAS